MSTGPNPESPEKSLSVIFFRLVCGLFYEWLSWLLVDIGGSIPRQVLLGRVRQAAKGREWSSKQCSFVVSASVIALSSFNNGRCDPVRWNESSTPLNDLSRVCYYGNGREARAGILSQIFKKRKTKVRTIKTPDGQLCLPHVHTCTYIAHTQTHTRTLLVSFLFLWLNALRKSSSWESDYSARGSRFRSITWGNQGGGTGGNWSHPQSVQREQECLMPACFLAYAEFISSFVHSSGAPWVVNGAAYGGLHPMLTDETKLTIPAHTGQEWVGEKQNA